MKTIVIPDFPLPDSLSVLCWFLVVSLLLLTGPATSALAAGELAVSWRANPPEDNVLGYRLYYGATSRFDSTGHLKPGFQYDRFIDFTESERCEGSNPQSCEALTAEDVVCENLWGDTPRCSISGLVGPLYLTMTAYNAQEESAYTRELYLAPPVAASTSVPGTSPPRDSTPIPPGTARMLQKIYTLLLLKN